ncbi:unnamed protein product [Moneuplotes crassus]|uniref:Lipase n=1 Tax=Euplotes crassus TaxID=5936 RepID=A0AAD1ULA0_EUPCR|nr:unnamed protein product [Moneuplotes crassus]
MNKCLIFGAIFFLCICPSLGQNHRDWYLNLEELCDRYGYQYEEHLITSEDGYVTMLQRVRARLGDDDPNREPFYANIPLGTGEAMLFLLGSEESPGFRIVDAGYDLWFLNPRGTDNSRGHVNPDIPPEEYWHFDLIDISQDHVAALTYIIDETGYPQVHAHGYSSGGLSLGHAIALHPDFFNPRIRSLHYVAATMTFAHTQFIGFQLIASIPGVLATLEDFGVFAMTTQNIPVQMIGGISCGMMPQFCLLMQHFIGGQVDPNYDDPDAYTNFIFRGFAGFATHLLSHAMQSVRTGEVTYFDLGEEENLAAYGQADPPRIPYENHQIPVAMYYSRSDNSADFEDGQWFADLIGDNCVAFNEYPGYSHFTFDIGMDMYFLDDMFDILQSYPIEVTN